MHMLGVRRCRSKKKKERAAVWRSWRSRDCRLPPHLIETAQCTHTPPPGSHHTTHTPYRQDDARRMARLLLRRAAATTTSSSSGLLASPIGSTILKCLAMTTMFYGAAAARPSPPPLFQSPLVTAEQVSKNAEGQGSRIGVWGTDERMQASAVESGLTPIPHCPFQICISSSRRSQLQSSASINPHPFSNFS